MTALNGFRKYLMLSYNRPAKIYPKFIRMVLVNVIPVLVLSNGGSLIQVQVYAFF